MKEETKQLLIIGVVLLLIIGIGSFTLNKKFERDALVNQQTEIEKTKIEEDKKTERAEKHLQWFPWN